jgi:hypothetical protein
MKLPTIFRALLGPSLGGPAHTHAQAPTQDLRSLQGTGVMEAAYGGRATACSVWRRVGVSRP